MANGRIHARWGRRGVCISAPACHILTYAVLAAHPPWPVLVVVNMVSGFGNGLTDGCFSAWVGAMDRANVIQGFMHACYSVGALFAPLIATNMVAQAGLPWYSYYYLMVGLSVLELVGLTATFWSKTGAVYRAEHAEASDGEGATSGMAREALKSRVTWLCSIYFFAYMGVEGMLHFCVCSDLVGCYGADFDV